MASITMAARDEALCAPFCQMLAGACLALPIACPLSVALLVVPYIGPAVYVWKGGKNLAGRQGPEIRWRFVLGDEQRHAAVF